ncbi:MAG: polysaccharide deacetylase family protein [Desulfurobacteriaceae bacterium]
MLSRVIVLLLMIIALFQSKVKGEYATIFIYHRFDDVRYPSTSVSLEDFEKELKFLKENNYNVISLKELYDIISKKGKIPPKTVVITIDDGYKSTIKAFRLLKKYNFPFTVFLYMEAIDRYPDFLTLKQIEEIKKYPKASFGNHLYSHKDLAKLRVHLNEKEYLNFLKRELALSENKFIKIFGRKPEFLAFPYGSYDRISVSFFKRKGYKLLLTQDRGNYDGKSLLAPRMALVGGLSRFKNFKRYLNIEPLPIKEQYPPYGLLEKNPTKIYFNLTNGKNYKNCSIYVSEYGWLKVKRYKDTVITANDVDFRKLKNRIGIRCFNIKSGKLAEHFFLVIKAPQGGRRVLR